MLILDLQDIFIDITAVDLMTGMMTVFLQFGVPMVVYLFLIFVIESLFKRTKS